MRSKPTAIVLGSLLLLSRCVSPGAALAEPPCDHANAAAAEDYGRVERAYHVPDVTLIDQTGRPVALKGLLEGSTPVVLNFIFATCGTVCPVLSASLAAFQSSLGEHEPRPVLVSITIDPEHDTPDVLRAYAARFGAGTGWAFLTGSRSDIDSVMRAFDVYVSNRMDHRPVTLLRGSERASWTRIEGFMGVADYAKEYAALVKR